MGASDGGVNDPAVLIYSSIYPLRAYASLWNLRITFRTFLNALSRQTCRRFRVFVAVSDVGEVLRRVVGEREVPEEVVWVPTRRDRWEGRDFGQKPVKKKDKWYKTLYAIFEAGVWAREHGLEEFWMMRLDNDDVLAYDTVERMVSLLEQTNAGAMMCKRSHIYDLRRGEMGVFDYGFPLINLAVRVRAEKEPGAYCHLHNWFASECNHTQFERACRALGIEHVVEKEDTFCILTNTGNNTSGKRGIDEGHNARWCYKIPLTSSLVHRYSLKYAMRCLREGKVEV